MYIRTQQRLDRAGKQFVIVALVLLVLTVSASECVANSEAGSAFTIDSLFETLRLETVNETRYVEIKHNHLLNEPQRSSGKLLYMAPDTLIRQVQKPRSERLTISGDDVTLIIGNQQPRYYHLSQAPAMRGLTRGLLAVIKGDNQQLADYFEIQLQGHQENWMLRLLPVDEQIKQEIKCIDVSGSQGKLTGYVVREQDQDRIEVSLDGELDDEQDVTDENQSDASSADAIDSDTSTRGEVKLHE